MDNRQYDIFISYRREGGSYYARILKAELEKRGYRDRVFLDYDELKDGRFDSRIMAAIDSAPIFIFILSPRSLDRCVNEDDWVRQEIIYALKSERHIIPINFDGLFTGFPSSVPSDVRNALGQHQFTKIDSESLLNVSVDKLIQDRLAPIVSPRENDSRPSGAEIVIIPDADCQVFRFNKLLASVQADTETVIRLLKGNHLLEFVSTQCPEVKEKVRYSVPDNDYSDFIEVKLQERILEQRTLYPYKAKNNKWGYIDKNGHLIIPCVYDYVFCFTEERLSMVEKHGKRGYIDMTGNVVIPLIYDSASIFTEGLALVTKNGKSGFIDKTGKMVIPCLFDFAMLFSEGLAFVHQDKKRGFIDKTGKFVIICDYGWVDSFCEGLAMVYNSKEDKYGYIDKTGKLVISCDFPSAYDFKEGFARVLNSCRFIGDSRWGFIDKNGSLVIPHKFDGAGDFSEGLAAVKKGLKWGFIEKTGTIVIPCVYDEVQLFKEGLACVKNNGKWGIIDRFGKVIVPYRYDSISIYKGLARINGGEEYIDKTGKVVIPKES